jgi:epoxyqueuosine reductase
MNDAQWVRAAAQSFGFHRVHFTTVDVPETDRDFFLSWCQAGRAGDMNWLTREPERRARPTDFHPESVSLISLGIRYYQGEAPPKPARAAGRVARYAWGRDYHDVIDARLKLFEEAMSGHFGADFNARHGLDAQPLLERAFARRAGLGFVGKNTNIIAPQTGSWIFLAEVLVNIPLPPDKPVGQGCGGCVKCQTGCPTDALKTGYQLDARECIAYHTIENRGAIPVDFRRKMGSWVFGCDDCQEICPFNARPEKTDWPELMPDQGVGPWLDLKSVLLMRTQEEFRARFKPTPLWRAHRAGLIRNACIVAANGGFIDELSAEIEACLLSDPDPLVRGTAAWALGQEPVRKNKNILERALLNEADENVKSEIKNGCLR